MEEVQAVMGVPEWFLYTDSRETKSLYGNKCIQESGETEFGLEVLDVVHNFVPRSSLFSQSH